MKIFAIIAVGIALVLLLFNNFFGQDKEIKEKEMKVDELKQRYGKDTNLVVLDVRTAEELSGPLGKIEKVIHIPVQELEGRLTELERYKNKEIAVICRSGNRSVRATSILLKNGFNARNVAGGMIDYRR